MIASNTPWFPAILRHAQDGVLARGEAIVLQEDQAVNFTSDFVPLYPMGTQMEIVRIHNGNEVHRFAGKVYLSDKKLMRIVSVEDELLPGSEEAYCGNLQFEAVLTSCQRPRPKRFSFFYKMLPEPQPFAVTIVELTHKQMTFYINEPSRTPLEDKRRFYLDPPQGLPLPAKTIVEVEHSLLFGGKASYLCNFPLLTHEDRDVLHKFLVEYNLSHNKLF